MDCKLSENRKTPIIRFNLFRLISNKWETAAITCKEDIELIVHESEKVPLQIRCIRKNISKFFDENDCEDHEMCKEVGKLLSAFRRNKLQPKNCESMKCEFGDQNPLWNLQLKIIVFVEITYL